MKNKHVNYFNHTKQFYQFVILKKINEYGSLNMPLDVDDPELIEAISNVHIKNLINDGFLISTDGELKLSSEGESALNKHYIDYQINLLNLSKNIGDFYIEKVNQLIREVNGKVALYGASDTSKSIFTHIQNAEIKILCVIDDDPIKQKNNYLGLPVIPIDSLYEFDVNTIIISTVEFQDEIKKKTVSRFGQKYKIITLFNSE